MILFVGDDVGIFLLSQEPIVTEETLETIEQDMFGWQPIPWPRRKIIYAASFTVQKRQTERIKATVDLSITASITGASKRHEERISVHEKTKISISDMRPIRVGRFHTDNLVVHEECRRYVICKNAIEKVDINNVILSIQNPIMERVADGVKKSKEERELIEIIMTEVA